MSILKKSYEISVWEDYWSIAENRFVEKKLCIIGTDKMMSQGRALEPTLTRCTNGTTKFSFKMYKWFIDSITGIKTENPFIQYLVAERKVKLKYENKWYEFLIKDINEPSSSHLYTFNLEDAFVNELSKNGFAFIFDPAQQNNLGTAQELGDRLLADTDWAVSSEAFVQTTEEALVHLLVSNTFQATHLLDQTDLTRGIQEQATKTTIPKDAKILAFYSCCKNQPHRFQFIYVEDGKYETNEKGIIINKNCQYYIDIPESSSAIGYVTHSMTTEGYSFVLPSVTTLYAGIKYNGKEDQKISLYARGNRYTYTQQTQYFPQIKKYLTAYTKNGVKYWSYSNTEYVAPNLITNLVSGLDFKSTSGWVGSFIGTKPDSISVSDAKTAIETVYGYWNGRTFVNISDDWEAGTFNVDDIDKYYAALRFKPNSNASVHGTVINSGFNDKKKIIKNIAPGDQFVLRIKACNKNHNYSAPLNDFTYSLADCEYDAENGHYVKKTVYCNTFTIAAEDNGYYYCVFTINNNANGLTPQQFSAKNIRFFIETSGARSPEYYLEDLQLFKYYEATNERGYMPIDEQGETLETSTITTHYFVTESQLEVASSVDDLTPVEEQTINYAIYQPFYCVGATKQRSVVAKESNYFNILQTIAETFEAWLEIVVNHTDDGKIISKMVRFKNYIGDNNYASFRYGVNLKGITRTNDSKAIVTKLIVKDNQNEHATNGFCSIKRAGSNITGENILYDFGYYANMGLLNALELERYLYIDGVISADGIRRGYYNALRVLNDKLEQNNAQLIEKQKAKIALDAELELANSTRKTALESYEQMSAEFEEAFGFAPQDQISGSTPALGDRSDYQKYIKELSIYLTEKNAAENTIATKTPQQTTLASEISALEADNKGLTTEKARIHKEFYTKYYRFIQEGTWIKEDYTDDEKYYADAQSTLYNSCYPKVTYTIDVLEISQLPGYEYFNFDIGDMTYAEDDELFGEGRAEVVVTEFVQNLDNPSKNTIKVQTYKNQFQDLFQKLTATSQQVQYNTGSYKKATSLADGNEALKQEFLLGSIEDVSQIIAGSSNTQSVTYDSRGIIVTDLASPMKQLRIVAGAIMLAEQDENGQQKWITGLTPQGISASLIRAGQLDVGTIQIMAGNEPSFRWDAYGITAYDFSMAGSNPTGFNKKKFVRFDRHGLYGADFTTPKSGLAAIDGSDWHPVTSEEVMRHSTFALTWEGLKVTGNDGVIAKIGKDASYIIKIGKENEEPYLTFSNDGTLKIGGWSVDQDGLTSNGNISTYNLRARTSPRLLLTTVGQQCTFNPNGVPIDLDNVVFKAGDNFMVTDDGKLYTNDGIFYGQIETEEGKIGGWSITQDGLEFANINGQKQTGLYAKNTVESTIVAHRARYEKKLSYDGKYEFWDYRTEPFSNGYTRFLLYSDNKLPHFSASKNLTVYNSDYKQWVNTLYLNDISGFTNLIKQQSNLVLNMTVTNTKSSQASTISIDCLEFAESNSAAPYQLIESFGFVELDDSGNVINVYQAKLYCKTYFSSDKYAVAFYTERVSVLTSSITNEFTIEFDSDQTIGNAEINSNGVASFYHIMATTGQLGNFEITSDGDLLTQSTHSSGDSQYTDYFLYSKKGIMMHQGNAAEGVHTNIDGQIEIYEGYPKSSYKNIRHGDHFVRLWQEGIVVGDVSRQDGHVLFNKMVLNENSLSYHSSSIYRWPDVGSYNGSATSISFTDEAIYIHKNIANIGNKRIKITPSNIYFEQRVSGGWETLKVL